MKILKLILPVTLVTFCLTGLMAILTPPFTRAGQSDPDGPDSPGASPSGFFLGRFRALDIEGSFAFLLGDGLHVVDVPDPAAPFELATWAGFAAPLSALDIENGYAFITVISGQLNPLSFLKRH